MGSATCSTENVRKRAWSALGYLSGLPGRNQPQARPAAVRVLSSALQLASATLRPVLPLILGLVGSLSALHGADQWQPVSGQMMTRWAGQVSPDGPWPEYPRPQMRREQWLNLNGLWEFAIAERSSEQPAEFGGQILVPFPIESALSGVKKAVSPEQALWYRRTFEVPGGGRSQRVLLHFGAVDWEAVVFVNGVRVGEHRGGYTPFSLDITAALRPEATQEVVVRVWDPTDTGTQARGKQVLEPQSIWYTAVTGIWQTVWLEPVPEVSIQRLVIVPDIDNDRLTVRPVLNGSSEGLRVRASVREGSTEIARAEGPASAPVQVSIPNPKLWSPDSPHLYDLAVQLMRGDSVVDEVESYAGMRKIALGKNEQGHIRLFLNDEPVFHLGPLDQGWWPDGLYTAPTDEALRYDIEVTKDLGFNMARKHVKVEPARWYYHCDRIGLMVWQDMPSAYLGGREPSGLFVGPWDTEDAPREGVSEAQFEAELREMIDALQGHPSIVMWVPFNEGWGQYDTARIANWTKQYDPTRLVNATSGWTDRGVGDVYDTHMYPGPGMQVVEATRASVLGEFGGLGWPVPDHLWWDKRNWGYRTYHSREELEEKYAEVLRNTLGPLSRGLAAAIYTQTTDVEGEVNGLMTYDRAIVKFDEDKLEKLHGPLYQEPRPWREVVPSSAEKQQEWRYTTKEPKDGWTELDFDAGKWQSGLAPFRSSPDPDFPNGAEWPKGPLWARRTFTLDSLPKSLWLEALHSVSKGAVYLNGTKIADIDSWSRREYEHRDVSQFLPALRIGANVVAVDAAPDDQRPWEGNRNLDVGLYAVE